MFSLIQIGERASNGALNIIDQWMSSGHGKPALSEAYDSEIYTALLPFSADFVDGISENRQ